MQQLLQRYPADLSMSRAYDDLTVDELQEKLDDLIARENPHCGEAMVKLVDKPFIGQMERDQGILDYWSIN